MDSPLIFISYRRRDSLIHARWLAESLQLAFGEGAVFIDSEKIRVGTNWKQTIDTALNRTTILLVVIGTRWLKLQDEDGRRRLDNPDDWVRTEIAASLRRSIPIIPILVEGADIPRTSALPQNISALSDFQAQIIRDSTWERDRNDLIQVIKGVGVPQKSEPIEYPLLEVHPEPLSDEQLRGLSDRLPNWSVVTRPKAQARSGKAVELHRRFEFKSFEDAIHFMSSASRFISKSNHHPDWRNMWRSVSVWLTTWDIGHRPSSFDLSLAEYLEELFQNYRHEE